MNRKQACAAWALLAVALVVAWSAARVHVTNGGNWTALFCSGEQVRLPPELDARSYRVGGVGYDGQFYRLMAYDPLLLKHYGNYVDAPQFRCRRALVPWLAWLLSVGQARWADAAYFAVEMIFLGLGVYWCARLFQRQGRSPAWGLLFIALPATIASFDRMLLDGPLTALFAGFLLYAGERRWKRVWVLVMLAVLTRETGLLMVGGLVGERLLRRDWRGAARFAACALPAVTWYAYIATRLPPNRGLTEIGIPVWTVLQRLLVFRDYFNALGQVVVRATDFLAVVALLVCAALAVLWLRRGPWDAVRLSVALYVCLALTLGEPVMAEPYAFGRVVSPLLLWLMLESFRRKNWLGVWAPLAISLGVSLALVRPAIEIARRVAIIHLR